MPDPKQETSGKLLTKAFTVTNTGRRRWIFPRLDGEVPLVVGDHKDHEGSETIPAETGRNPKLQPDPRQTITPEIWEGIGEQGRAAFTNLVERGIFRAPDGPFRVREAA